MASEGEIPLLLQEMNLAWAKEIPETEGEKEAAKWLSEDAKGFRAQYVTLQKQFSGGGTAGLEGGGEVVWDGVGHCPTCGHQRVKDEGSGRAEELCDRLLEG